MEPIIILKSGEREKLSVYQDINNLKADKVAPHFSTHEMFNPRYGNFFHMSEYLLIVLELFRARTGQPVILNSAYRPQAQQEDLQKQTNHAAKRSPHPEGMAADIETKTRKETLEKVRILEQISQETGITLRIGFASYLNDGMTFIHVDVAPMYFAKNKIYHSINHPYAWELEARW